MGRPRPPPSPLGGSFRDGPHGRDIHPLLIRLTISVSDCRWPGRIAASGECATYLLNSTLPGAVRLKVEGHGVADRERQCIALRLHRPGSGGVARESGPHTSVRVRIVTVMAIGGAASRTPSSVRHRHRSTSYYGCAVQHPANTHVVPLKAIERWLRKPSVSPKEAVAKRARFSESRGRRSIRSQVSYS